MNNRKSSDMIPTSTTSNFDMFKWTFVVLLFCIGLWANYYYYKIDWALKFASWIVLSCVMIGIALQTILGQKAWVFVKEARGELRKVFWPTRQETIQTTMIVIAMVVLMSVILWGIDSFLLWVVAGLTGRG